MKVTQKFTMMKVPGEKQRKQNTTHTPHRKAKIRTQNLRTLRQTAFQTQESKHVANCFIVHISLCTYDGWQH